MVFCYYCFVRPCFRFLFFVIFGNEVTKILKYYRKKNGKKITQSDQNTKNQKKKFMGWTKHICLRYYFCSTLTKNLYKKCLQNSFADEKMKLNAGWVSFKYLFQLLPLNSISFNFNFTNLMSILRKKRQIKTQKLIQTYNNLPS